MRALLLPKLLPAAAARSPRRASDPTRTQPIGPCARCSNGRARGGRSSPSRATPRPSGPLHIVETARAAPRIPASRPGHWRLAWPSPDTTRAPPIAPAALPLRRPPTPPRASRASLLVSCGRRLRRGEAAPRVDAGAGVHAGSRFTTSESPPARDEERGPGGAGRRGWSSERERGRRDGRRARSVGRRPCEAPVAGTGRGDARGRPRGLDNVERARGPRRGAGRR